MKIRIFSLFPEMFEGPLTASLLGKACDKGILSIEVVNFRDYALDKHRHVDDTPYGGGQGMVLMPQPLVDALEDHAPTSANSEVILLSPQGKPFSQADAVRLSKREDLAFVCGHYEGFDERIRHFVDSEYSIGDYVLTGGELPAMVMIDTIARLIPGVIKEQASYEEDSFFQGLLEYPQYTKPRDYRGMEVPEVLLSGHHANIRRWQKKEALRRTWQRRPDLLADYPFSPEEEALFQEVQAEEGLSK
ncbi:tRNA (guanosine(37)-N1)-methyltransferase TrmD [Peptococcus simiae]|uniref:tRNA (guanosine(37)-N1)-methyltransferase TrmD n=1 Tax=Peptococcus simiae TaxID=1643805 RepID=UPI0039818C2D